jgi:hypothetical protein
MQMMAQFARICGRGTCRKSHFTSLRWSWAEPDGEQALRERNQPRNRGEPFVSGWCKVSLTACPFRRSFVDSLWVSPLAARSSSAGLARIVTALPKEGPTDGRRCSKSLHPSPGCDVGGQSEHRAAERSKCERRLQARAAAAGRNVRPSMHRVAASRPRWASGKSDSACPPGTKQREIRARHRRAARERERLSEKLPPQVMRPSRRAPTNPKKPKQASTNDVGSGPFGPPPPP